MVVADRLAYCNSNIFRALLIRREKEFRIEKENTLAEIESSKTPSETEEKAEEIVSENAAESVAPEDNNLTE